MPDYEWPERAAGGPEVHGIALIGRLGHRRPIGDTAPAALVPTAGPVVRGSCAFVARAEWLRNPISEPGLS